MPDFSFVTPWKGNRDFYEETAGKKTVVFFLRYYGCSTCQLEIHNIIKDYPRFAAKGAKVFVVLQSDPETLRSETEEKQIPFEIICDPEQALYKMLNIGAYDSPPPRSEKLERKIKEARALGITHGKYEGNEQQLPATFIIDGQHQIVFAHYGKESVDIPEHEDLLRLL
jgi:Peroxiredoxin